MYFNVIYLCGLIESFCCLNPIFIRLSVRFHPPQPPLKLLLLRQETSMLLRLVVILSPHLTYQSYLIQLYMLSSVKQFLNLLLGHYTLLFSFASLSSGSFAGCSSQSGVSQISALALFCFVFTLPPGYSFLGYCFKYQIYAGKSQICISSPDLLTGLQTCISSLQ